MGYSYDYGTNRLCCDNCGQSGGVRKRKCPFTVTSEDGITLPYCYPSAVCPACYKIVKHELHAKCREGAAKSQAEYDAKRARIESGDLQVLAAWGSWYGNGLEDGEVLVSFGAGRTAATRDSVVYRVLPKDHYTGGGFLSDYPLARPADHITGHAVRTTTKQVA